MKADISRRGAIVAVGSLAGCFVLGGGVKALASDSRRIRPPGGQDEARLRALCVKCDRCRTACPAGIVVPVSVEDGLLGARTPQLDFHLGYCDFCGLCQKVCPTQALSPEFNPEVESMGVARVDVELCLAYGKGCVKCKDSCRFGALEFDEKNRPHVDEARCNGCGECVDACQVNILGVYSGRERALEVHAS